MELSVVGLYIPEQEPVPAVVVVGLPDPDIVEQLAVRGGTTIKGALGGENEIWLGRPEAFNLLELYADRHSELSPMILAQAETTDFHAIRLTCSFRPASGCQFLRASLRVWLEPQPPSRPGVAVAYHMQPADLVTPLIVKRTFGVSPALTLTLSPVTNVELSGPQAERSTEHISYEPQLSTFGLGSDAPGWDFNKTRAQPIQGSRELFLVVKMPRGVTLQGRFDLSATVQSSLPGLGRIPLTSFLRRGSSDPLISERHLLVRGQ